MKIVLCILSHSGKRRRKCFDMNFLHEVVDQGRRATVDALSGGGIERDAPFSPDVPPDLREWMPDLFDRFPIVTALGEAAPC